VLSSHITTATRGSGGGYASFSLSIPTGNLQDAMTQLSRLHYVAVVSSDNSSQNVSRQYNSDQRQLTDAQALRTSLLKQLAAATTDQEIDSIKAQLKLAEQQITSWQNTLGSLQHRISYSNLSVQVNQNGLPIIPVAKHHSSGFTISHAGHDAMRVLVVSAGVALITLAVMIPVGLVAALLMWLWVWLRQRRREHALDSAS
jgi:Flp pilus assembly protein TadB